MREKEVQNSDDENTSSSSSSDTPSAKKSRIDFDKLVKHFVENPSDFEKLQHKMKKNNAVSTSKQSSSRDIEHTVQRKTPSDVVEGIIDKVERCLSKPSVVDAIKELLRVAEPKEDYENKLQRKQYREILATLPEHSKYYVLDIYKTRVTEIHTFLCSVVEMNAEELKNARKDIAAKKSKTEKKDEMVKILYSRKLANDGSFGYTVQTTVPTTIDPTSNNNEAIAPLWHILSGSNNPETDVLTFLLDNFGELNSSKAAFTALSDQAKRVAVNFLLQLYWLGNCDYCVINFRRKSYNTFLMANDKKSDTFLMDPPRCPIKKSGEKSMLLLKNKGISSLIPTKVEIDNEEAKRLGVLGKAAPKVNYVHVLYEVPRKDIVGKYNVKCQFSGPSKSELLLKNYFEYYDPEDKTTVCVADNALDSLIEFADSISVDKLN